MNTETELRHAVIDRLIAASLRDGAASREAALQNWRSIDTKHPVPNAAGKTVLNLQSRA